jgi:ABC-2 type transport system permease protein
MKIIHRIPGIAFYTLMRKETMRVFRIWVQTLLPAPVSMALYFLIFGSILGHYIRLDAPFASFSYMAYITPGLIAMAVINNAYTNAVNAFFMAKFLRYIEDLYVSSMSGFDILCGFLSAAIIRGILVGFTVLIMSSFWISVSVAHWGILLMVMFVVSLLWSSLGLINGIFSRHFDDVSIVPSFVLTPLIYLGGVFYTVDQLPDIGKTIMYWNPLFYIIDLFRYGFLGVSLIPWLQSFSILSAITLVIFFLAWYLVEKGQGVRH